MVKAGGTGNEGTRRRILHGGVRVRVPGTLGSLQRRPLGLMRPQSFRHCLVTQSPSCSEVWKMPALKPIFYSIVLNDTGTALEEATS